MRTERQINQTIRKENKKIKHLLLTIDYATDQNTRQKAVIKILSIARVYLRQVTAMYDLISKAANIAIEQPKVFTGPNVAMFLHAFIHRTNVIMFAAGLGTAMVDNALKNNRKHIVESLGFFERQQVAELWANGQLTKGENSYIDINGTRFANFIKGFGYNLEDLKTTYKTTLIGLTAMEDIYNQCRYAHQYISRFHAGPLEYNDAVAMGAHLFLGVVNIDRELLRLSLNELLVSREQYFNEVDKVGNDSVIDFATWWVTEGVNCTPSVRLQ